MNKGSNYLKVAIKEGACRVCNWNGEADEDEKICARSVANLLIKMQDHRSNRYKDKSAVDGLIVEYDRKAQDCAWTLINAGNSDTSDDFTPTETFGLSEIINKIED